MFSLLRKTWIQISGALHDLLDKFGDAGRSARHGLRELQRQIGQAEESVSDVAAELRLMQHQCSKATEDADKWGRVAEKAAAAGDKTAAVEAVHHQVRSEEMAHSYGANIARLSPMLDQLKIRLSDLRKDLKDKENRAALLGARSKVADAETRAARSLGNVGNRPGIDFDQLEEQVDRKEAKAASLADMAQDKSALDVDKRLSDYVRLDAVNAKLQGLGLVSAGGAAICAQGGDHA